MSTSSRRGLALAAALVLAVAVPAGAHASAVTPPASVPAAPTPATTQLPGATPTPVDHTGHDVSGDEPFPVLPVALSGLAVVIGAVAFAFRGRLR